MLWWNCRETEELTEIQAVKGMVQTVLNNQALIISNQRKIMTALDDIKQAQVDTAAAVADLGTSITTHSAAIDAELAALAAAVAAQGEQIPPGLAAQFESSVTAIKAANAAIVDGTNKLTASVTPPATP